MHYARTFIAIALLGAGCACATFLLAAPLSPEQHKASDFCDKVFMDSYAECLQSSSNIKECLDRAAEARKVCRKNSGLPMQKPPPPPKVRGDNPSGKPSASGASPTPKPLRHVDGLRNAETQTLTTTSPTPKPLRHVDGLGNAQTQTLTKTSPTPTPKPSRSPSGHKG